MTREEKIHEWEFQDVIGSIFSHKPGTQPPEVDQSMIKEEDQEAGAPVSQHSDTS